MKTAPGIIWFLSAALVISTGCGLLLAGVNGSGACFGVATVFIIPRSDWQRPVPRGELWLMLGLLFSFLAIILTCVLLVPGPTSATLRHVICHPAVVLPVWLILIAGLIRNWRRQKTAALETEKPGSTP